ncbi:MAG: NADH-quinone oxidoreductase subunit L [Nitrospiria bacterium]
MSMPHPALILLFPLFAGILIPILRRRLGEGVAKIGILAQIASFVLSIIVLVDVSYNPPIHIRLFPTPPIEPALFRFGLYIDRLSAVMMVLITGVSMIVHLFSRTYLQQDSGYARYFSLLSLITFSLLSLVTSPNLFMFFVFWQLISWLLYLLLSYNYAHTDTCRAAFKTLMILRIGDLFFLAGLLGAYTLFGTLDFPDMFHQVAASTATFEIFFGWEISQITIVSLLIFVGAMSKSAQFPLHVWLPDTMFGPTPVSALMHAGIVNAGGFLLNRLAPLYGQSPTSLNIIFGVGALTTFLGAGIMLCQNDVKKMLGYSTIAQMGYMIMECGLGAFALAIFHFIAHGLFKASLFLSAGSIVHTTRIDPKTPKRSKTEEGLSQPETSQPFSLLTWLTGLVITLILPLIILFAAHGAFHIPLTDEAHGAVIFLFFGWVTSSQAIISLYRMNTVASWKVVCAMIAALVLIIFTYLFAGEKFTLFLYPAPGEAAHYFEVAALHIGLFDLFIVLAIVAVVSVWIFLYANARGRHILMPSWVNRLKTRCYVASINGFYFNKLYRNLAKTMTRFVQVLDKRLLAWLP